MKPKKQSTVTFKYDIGDTLIDSFTDFQGMVVERKEDFLRINSYTLQPKGKANQVLETYCFPEQTLKPYKEKKIRIKREE